MSTRIAVHVIEGAPALSSRMRHIIRARYVENELERIGADLDVTPSNDGVNVWSRTDGVRHVDGLAALGLLIEIPDGAGSAAAWSALASLPVVT